MAVKCAYHPENVAVVQCANCGSHMCPVCYERVEGKSYCHLCVRHLFGRQVTPTIASGGAAETSNVAWMAEAVKKTSWFERHLNWTWVLSYLLVLVGAFVFGLLIFSADPNVSEDAVGDVAQIFGGIFMAIVSGWVIKQKGRSLWWILLSGVFSPLWLENRKKKP